MQKSKYPKKSVFLSNAMTFYGRHFDDIYERYVHFMAVKIVALINTSQAKLKIF